MKWQQPLLILIFVSCFAYSQETEWYCNDQENTKTRWIDTNLGKQKVLIAMPDEINEKTNMLVYVHGDAPFNNPVEQYYIARDISAVKNYISVAILRPGYEDNCGSISEGIRGRTMGDNYTKEVIESTAKIVAELNAEHKPNKLVLMGHSGGGALSTLLLSTYPGLFDEAFIFSCPCNLPVWRKGMYDAQGDPRWLEKMSGLSPLDHVKDLDPQVPITFVVGANDDITPPSLTQEFVSEAKQHNKIVTVQIWEEHDHLSVLFREGFRRMLNLLN